MVEVIHWASKEGVPMGRDVESMVGARRCPLSTIFSFVTSGLCWAFPQLEDGPYGSLVTGLW